MHNSLLYHSDFKNFSVKIFLYFLQGCFFCGLEQRFWILKTIFVALFVPHLCIVFAAVCQKHFLFYRDIKRFLKTLNCISFFFFNEKAILILTANQKEPVGIIIFC